MEGFKKKKKSSLSCCVYSACLYFESQARLADLPLLLSLALAFSVVNAPRNTDFDCLK